MDNLRTLKQFCLDLFIKTKDKNVRKIMRKLDKMIEEELNKDRKTDK